MNKILARLIALEGFEDAPTLTKGELFVRDAKVICQFLLASNCVNIEPVKIFEPTERQIRAAKRRNNPPFNSYWTLNCCFDQVQGNRSGTGEHASPRLHVRRGHVRHLASGKLTWVRQCLVGDASLGEVRKDYRPQLSV